MNSPIILLVFWFVINILIKSAKDKKKIEESRRIRAQQIENKPIQNNTTQAMQRQTSERNTNKNRSLIDVFKDEIEKEINKEKQNKPIKIEQKVNNKKFVTEDDIERNSNWRDDYFSANTDEETVEIKTYYRKPSLDLKNDLLKGIIFSEILSKPKSIQNGKRSM